ncbi:MAG: hydroxyisourate hydrolase [Bacteroidota bacterium]|nr:hydroxyisourate hydrolase [Bacteroidota bacterium]
MTKLTTHILDTSKGRPAEGVTIILYIGGNDKWKEIARTKTNTDGRAAGAVNGDETLVEGIYKLRFETKDYFDNAQVATFYPYVEIVFEIGNAEHYHVPLLLNPFGYSTYRGS